MYFHARTSELGPWTVIHVVGELDLASAPRYRSELVRAASSGPVLVDLRDCDLIDSVGLGLTLGAARRSWAGGHRFAVLVSAAARRSFELARVDEIVDVLDSVDELGLEESARP